MHESNSHMGAGPPEPGDKASVSELESIYVRYGQGIYTFCMRLLANEKAAESATVDVFVRFNNEMENRPDESRALLLLRDLAIKASLARVDGHGRTVLRRLVQGLRLTLLRTWRRLINKEVHK